MSRKNDNVFSVEKMPLTPTPTPECKASVSKKVPSPLPPLVPESEMRPVMMRSANVSETVSRIKLEPNLEQPSTTIVHTPIPKSVSVKVKKCRASASKPPSKRARLPKPAKVPKRLRKLAPRPLTAVLPVIVPTVLQRNMEFPVQMPIPLHMQPQAQAPVYFPPIPPFVLAGLPAVHLDVPLLDGVMRTDFGSMVDHRIMECPNNRLEDGCPVIETCMYRHINNDGTTICGPWVNGNCPLTGFDCLFAHRNCPPVYCPCCGTGILNREFIETIPA